MTYFFWKLTEAIAIFKLKELQCFAREELVTLVDNALLELT